MPLDQRTQTFVDEKALCRKENAPTGHSSGGENPAQLSGKWSDDGGLEGRAGGLVGRNGVLAAKGQADVVEPLEEPPAAEIVERERPDGVVHAHLTGHQVDRDGL